MRPIGFSTGALAFSDFRGALDLLKDKPVDAIELSALRLHELIPLLQAIHSLDLSRYKYTSLHAPSAYEPQSETEISRALMELTPPDWPIIVHPDTIHDFDTWSVFGDRLCIENMDRRKPVGRTAEELEVIFSRLPTASLCFDIGHARQCDTTMTEAYLILRKFRGRVRQVHVSEVNTASQHDPLTYASIFAFHEVSWMLPPEAPLILEARVVAEAIDKELWKVAQAFNGVQDGQLIPHTREARRPGDQFVAR